MVYCGGRCHSKYLLSKRDFCESRADGGLSFWKAGRKAVAGDDESAVNDRGQI